MVLLPSPWTSSGIRSGGLRDTKPKDISRVKGFSVQTGGVGRLIARLVLVLVSSAAVTHAAETHPAASQRLIDFNRDVRPILSENCFACHGPDKNKRKAGLRLDLREDATAKLDSGDYAVVPGDVTRSALVKVIATDDEEDRMPPKKTGKRLTKAQITLLREWIAQGAGFKQHWSYLTPERPPLPSVQNKTWPRNAIDNFILS